MRRVLLILVAGLAFAPDARANLMTANRAATGDVTIVNVPWVGFAENDATPIDMFACIPLASVQTPPVRSDASPRTPV